MMTRINNVVMKIKPKTGYAVVKSLSGRTTPIVAQIMDAGNQITLNNKEVSFYSFNAQYMGFDKNDQTDVYLVKTQALKFKPEPSAWLDTWK